MSQFVESLKRLYQAGSVTEAKIAELLTSGKITAEEVSYIRG